MAAYDQTLAKSLLTGDSKDLGKMIGGDLEKAHVKAHFRLNPKTGRREFIKDYDDARHKDQVHVAFHKGHKVKVNNPRSKHHGKAGTITSYSDKYNEVGVKFDDGGHGLHKPDHVDHHGAKADTKKTAAKKAKKKVSSKRYEGVNRINNSMEDLGVKERDPKIYHHIELMTQRMKRQMVHEVLGEMDGKGAQALVDFATAASDAGTAYKAVVAAAYDRLVAMAKKKFGKSGAKKDSKKDSKKSTRVEDADLKRGMEAVSKKVWLKFDDIKKVGAPEALTPPSKGYEQSFKGAFTTIFKFPRNEDDYDWPEMKDNVREKIIDTANQALKEVDKGGKMEAFLVVDEKQYFRLLVEPKQKK